MTDDSRPSRQIEFIVGSEKKLRDLLSAPEVTPLLGGAIQCGAKWVALLDARDRVLWEQGESIPREDREESRPLRLEGETVGRLILRGDPSSLNLNGLSNLLRDATQLLVDNNLKRMLTTEIHTSVVSQSYEELLETNRRLRVSEGNYRELAEKLEIKVQERTGELKRALVGLLQREKMASVGRLAAGMAHEINNPLGFIISNLNTLRHYTERMRKMLDLYREVPGKTEIPAPVLEELQKTWKDLKLDFIRDDLEELIGQSLEGGERIQRIVSDLKDFSHIDDSQEVCIDLNEEIDRTLKVLAHEIPEESEILREFHPLPGITCNAARMGQVFLNILLNAFQSARKGLRLVIRTSCEEGRIRIRFEDNGPGIPEEILDHIFEPFYTTREVGQGTGMGLTVAYEVITSYGGTIEVRNGADHGATVLIQLPISRREDVTIREALSRGRAG